MVTFADALTARLARLEEIIAKAHTADPSAALDSLWEQWARLKIGNLSGGTTGSGGLTQAQTQAAITAALEAANLQEIDANTEELETVLKALEVSVGKGSDTAITNTLIGLLKAIDEHAKAATATTVQVQRMTAAGSVAAGAAKAAIANTGSADGVLAGSTLKPGEVISVGDRRVQLAAIPYDATGTEFLIITETE